jgi:hypothetical protein
MAATQLPEPNGAFAGPFVKLAERNRALFERTLHAAQEESLRAMQRRLERNARALEDMCSADGIGALMAVEQNWLMGALQDSLEDTKRMATFWLRVAGEERETESGALDEAVRRSEAFAQNAEGERPRKSAQPVK